MPLPRHPWQHHLQRPGSDGGNRQFRSLRRRTRHRLRTRQSSSILHLWRQWHAASATPPILYRPSGHRHPHDCHPQPSRPPIPAHHCADETPWHPDKHRYHQLPSDARRPQCRHAQRQRDLHPPARHPHRSPCTQFPTSAKPLIPLAQRQAAACCAARC